MIASFTPEAPDWTVRWEEIDRALPWIAAMRDVPQDPIHHAEGDVWIHTRMVCEALVALPAWRELDAPLRERLFVAALLHDVAKPKTTVVQDDGRVRSPGHSPTGSVMARELLWRAGWPASVREPVCGLIRFHQVPYFAVDHPEARSVVIRLSQSVSARELAMLCEADIRGRHCADQPGQLDNIELFREYCTELGCFEHPYPFASDHARAM
ncbi:MAG: HD domain-containing protein, partial [Deltaproteobacteria bacterium]|nr:HD domain-containing protein [Nannocystaceae bacterium]